jgi:drug/metabolite transporter (DMT)-like permease
MSLATARNILIILVVAALLAIIPGGGTAGSLLLTALSLGFLAALGWAASIVYREHRETLYLLGERRRAVLYGAVVVLAVTLAATSRMWNSGSSLEGIAWIVLVGGAIYVGGAVLYASRRQ